MFMMQEEMEIFFTTLIKRVKDEHHNFKKWISHFGFNNETMNFINMINEHNYNNISGIYMNQILSALFMSEEKAVDTNFSVDECQKTLKHLENELDRVKDLYQFDFKKEKFSSISTTVSSLS